MKVGDVTLIDSPVDDSPFKGLIGTIVEEVGGGYLLNVPGYGDYFTTERWLTVLVES